MAFVHTVADNSRVAYAEIYGHETSPTAAAVLRRVVPWSGRPGGWSYEPWEPTLHARDAREAKLMLVGGGLILWALVFYVVLAVLSAVLVLAVGWYSYRAVHVCVCSFRAEPDRRLHPSLMLTPERARRNYEHFVRLSAGEGLRPQRR